MHVSLFIFVALLANIHAEELLNSKFSYDEALLEKMIRNEIRLEQVQEEVRATLGRVESTLKDIQKTNQNMKEEFNHLNKTTLFNVREFMKNSTGVIYQQKEEIGRMSEDLQSQYTNHRQNLTGEFNHLNQTTFVNVREFMKNSTGVTYQQKEEIGRMSEDLQSLYTDLRQNLTESISTPIIGFKATGIKDTSPSAGEVLVFPTVLSNAGNGYDSSNGIFTAPVDGLYMFTSQLCTYQAASISASIMVEETEVGRSFTHGPSRIYPCNTGDAFAEVKAGQKVLVKAKYVSGDLHTDQYRLLSFSGALLNK